MDAMYDVTAIGELLIDFTPAGRTDRGDPLFSQNPGGAPANVLAMLTKLGGRSAFIGQVGKDAFGEFLRETLDRAGVSTEGLLSTGDCHTTLAFVHLDDRGDRSFSFYRNPGADMMLGAEDVQTALIDHCAIFHYGSVSLTQGPCREATHFAANYARQAGKLVSFDPNYRPLLWGSAAEAAEEIRFSLRWADLVKVSEEELTLLTGETDLEAGSRLLLAQGASLVLVSRGAKGAFYNNGAVSGGLPTYDVKTVDTTGAGDAFLGAVLYRLRGLDAKGLRALSREQLEDIISFGNAAGSLTTAQKGAIPSLPTAAKIEECRKNVPLLLK